MHENICKIFSSFRSDGLGTKLLTDDFQAKILFKELSVGSRGTLIGSEVVMKLTKYFTYDQKMTKTP